MSSKKYYIVFHKEVLNSELDTSDKDVYWANSIPEATQWLLEQENVLDWRVALVTNIKAVSVSLENV